MPTVGRHKLTGDMAVLIRALQRRRQELFIGNEILDDQLGFTRGMVSKWENGVVSPTLFHLCCWAEALGLHITITSGPSPTDPIAEKAYRRWLKTTGRLNTPNARKMFKGHIGLR